MKSLSNCINDKQTELFDKTGAFFAFSNEQLAEGKTVEGIYCALGAGLYCPKANAKELNEGLDKIYSEGIAQDIEENGISAIIHRELANHEAQISGEIYDDLITLGGYGVTEEQVQAEYRKFYTKCVENDWF